MNHINWINL